MEPKVQMTEYKKSFWCKIKEKIFNIFFKNKEYIEEKNVMVAENNKVEKIEDNSKKEFMKVYEQVKKQEISLDDLEDNMLYKVMLFLKEEIDITNKKIKAEINETAIHVNNLNLNNKI